MHMAENDPYSERKKNVETTATNRDNSDMNRNPDLAGGQGRDEDDDTTSVQQRTNIGGTGKDMNEDDEEESA